MPATASATPVATNDGQYSQYGAVFPDPLGGCNQSGIKPCSPSARGNLPATQFIGYEELVSGLTFLNSKPQWRRYLEVWPLDGKIGDGSGTNERSAFPGNDLGKFEFTPNAAFRSAGLPTTGLGRKHSDLIAARVTDERVPDRGKKKYVVSLSIHGIERAGAEGGTRAIEDLVTAATTRRLGKRILQPGVSRDAPTFGEVLRKTVIYILYPNPDGWRRGSVSEGGVFFQRYNGNGVDLNRDWPEVGFSFRPYSAWSEPESRAFGSMLTNLKSRVGKVNGAVDLHGQLTADALSYTLIGHGSHDYAKDDRIRRTATAIHQNSEKALAWSPIVQPNSAPQGGGVPCTPSEVAQACAKIYGQTWGTVYDTINYTTTGAMGDWYDAGIGLNADGLDNEMSFSHLDRNIAFDPHGEQMHVDGNKALMYAQIAQIVAPPKSRFEIRGRKAYVPNARLRRKRRAVQGGPPPGTSPQPDIVNRLGTPDPAAGGVVLPIDVQRSSRIYNGGMRVDVTNLNAQGVGTGVTTLTLQCRDCDAHAGEKSPDGWVTVTQDFNQSPGYLQAGVTAAVNRPQAREAHGKKVQWRALLQNGGAARFDVDFTSGPATPSAETAPGALPPELRAYDVANTDFYPDLNRYIPVETRRFRKISPRLVLQRKQRLGRVHSLALSDTTLGTSRLSARQASTWYSMLRKWVGAGGNLVLTDAALAALPDLVSRIPRGAVTRRHSYVGQVAFATADEGDTLRDPLSRDVKQPGARFNGGMRRQTYEPTPIGFTIQDQAGADLTTSPVWQVDRAAFTRAGGRIAATSVEDKEPSGPPDHQQVSIGEIKLGKGTIRVAGALLPQPTEAFHHDLGLEPYALTYTGYTLMANLLRPARCVDDIAPRSRVTRVRARDGRLRLRGRATDRGCRAKGAGKVRRVTVAIARRVRRRGRVRCRYLRRNGRFGKVRSCHTGRYLRARGSGRWRFTSRRALPRGRYEIRARAYDTIGNRETGRTRRNTRQLRKRR